MIYHNHTIHRANALCSRPCLAADDQLNNQAAGSRYWYILRAGHFYYSSCHALPHQTEISCCRSQLLMLHECSPNYDVTSATYDERKPVVAGLDAPWERDDEGIQRTRSGFSPDWLFALHALRRSRADHPILHGQPLTPALLGGFNLRDDRPLQRPHEGHGLQRQHVVVLLHRRPSATLGGMEIIPPLLLMQRAHARGPIIAEKPMEDAGEVESRDD